MFIVIVIGALSAVIILLVEKLYFKLKKYVLSTFEAENRLFHKHAKLRK